MFQLHRISRDSGMSQLHGMSRDSGMPPLPGLHHRASLPVLSRHFFRKDTQRFPDPADKQSVPQEEPDAKRSSAEAEPRGKPRLG